MCSYKETTELDFVKNRTGVMQLNCRGLKSKITSLEHLLNYDLKMTNIKAVMLVGTWLKPGEDRFINIHGYNFIGQPRPNRKGGGVGLLLTKDLNYRVLSNRSEPEFECIVVELKGPGKELIGTTYRPPNTDARRFLEYYDKMTLMFKHRSLTLGIDYNLDLIKSDQHELTQRYLEMNYDKGLLPTITKPTR